jgi:hypothetical protein
MTAALRLRLFSRPGCHLCEDMAAILAEMGLPFERVNIEGDAVLEAEYGPIIPVLFHNDAEVARAPQSARTLTHALQRAGVI